MNIIIIYIYFFGVNYWFWFWVLIVFDEVGWVEKGEIGEFI